MISPTDTVECDGDRVVHLDCRLPSRLSREERALLVRYCWDHAVADCARCARRFRQHELIPDPFAGGADRCPKCSRDLTDNIRAHLYSCATLPVEVLRRAHEVRAASEQLIKHNGQLHDQADVLMRETEIALALLRDAIKQSSVEGLRCLIRVKLADGSLPHAGVPETIAGYPGDDFTCGVCNHIIPSREVMMLVTSEGSSAAKTPIALHFDCFELWNEERRAVDRRS